jgi:hypothetical protein
MPTLPTRRNFLSAVGSVGAVTLTGAFPSFAGPAPIDLDGGRPVPLAKAPVPGGKLGPVRFLNLAASDFTGLDSSTYAYVSPGGVQVKTNATFFGANLMLPAGTTILKVHIFLNPKGVAQTAQFRRYNPRTLAFSDIATKIFPASNTVETVSFTFQPHVMENGWNYRVGNIFMEPNGAVLYGGMIQYRLAAT